jgi:hypothetical protein
MAAAPGGLTASIRRKLQDGIAPEDIVKELSATGMSAVSAQRFVERAQLEQASAPPLPPAPAAPAQGDGLDQFIQNKSAETEAVDAQSGRKSLWVASALMCVGVLITGVSFIMANEGESFTLMWGPVVFGFFLWGKTVVAGLSDFRRFAWFSAIGALLAPIILTVVLLAAAVATTPMDDEAQSTDDPAAETASR